MIKVNLLDSVTDRARSVTIVEARVADPRARTWMLALVVGLLTVCGMAFDLISANSAHASAQTELARQEQIKAQMEAVNKEQIELEKKIKDVQARIDAIKKLRTSQQGPVAALSAINERLPAIANFRLETIEQKSGELIVEGDSPNEAAVTQFGRSLEFSSGLFTNVNIETERKTLSVDPGVSNDSSGATDLPATQIETVKFKIKCKYTAPGSSASVATIQADGKPTGAPGNQIAQK